MCTRQLNQQLISYQSHSYILIRHIFLFHFLPQDGFPPVYLFDSSNRSQNICSEHYWKQSKVVTFLLKLRIEDRNNYEQSHSGTWAKDQDCHLILHNSSNKSSNKSIIQYCNKSSNIAQCSRIPVVEISHKMVEYYWYIL